MSNMRLATWLAIGGATAAVAGIFVIARWPDDSLALIDKAPIKAVLIALTLSIIALTALIAYKTFHVPSLRRYCTTMGTVVVGTLLIPPVGYGFLSFQSASFVYGQNPSDDSGTHVEAKLDMKNDAGLYATLCGMAAAGTFLCSTLIYLLIVWVEGGGKLA